MRVDDDTSPPCSAAFGDLVASLTARPLHGEYRRPEPPRLNRKGVDHTNSNSGAADSNPSRSVTSATPAGGDLSLRATAPRSQP